MANANQKANKVLIESSENESYSSEHEYDSSEYERTPKLSHSPGLYEDLISAISLTLNQRDISHSIADQSYETLNTLVSTLCTEFLKSPYSNESRSEDQTENVIDKLFIQQHSSASLDSSECNALLELIIDLLRQSRQDRLEKQIQYLERLNLASDSTINSLRKSLSINKEKPDPGVPFKNQRKFIESDSTFNESQDFY